MFKPTTLPLSTGHYRIIAPPKAAQQDKIVKLHSRKCSRLGCNNPCEDKSIWCREHPDSKPNTSLDNIPAITEEKEP